MEIQVKATRSDSGLRGGRTGATWFEASLLELTYCLFRLLDAKWNEGSALGASSKGGSLRLFQDPGR
jgi:hypothetical protein